MIGRTSLLDQKKLQWAKERGGLISFSIFFKIKIIFIMFIFNLNIEELGRLGGNWGPVKVSDSIRSAIR